ncbi:RNA-binding protein with serine-rich domain 1-B-like [Homarus americanus]|uniref:RNA-binding protein with serine-rich domain 1-B-like n=1 Tax=Homarus americanus TaxID=6706 RepID=A0A8J5MX65_HOMAM|nr:RNA-binding protein with serine-rich domain 1-B-like [Homarus americanus]
MIQVAKHGVGAGYRPLFSGRRVYTELPHRRYRSVCGRLLGKRSTFKAGPDKSRSQSHEKKTKPKKPSKSRSRSGSPRPRRKPRSPTPRPTRIHVGRLTRNINRDHLHEIFAVYGSVKSVDLPMYDMRNNSSLNRGYGYIDFEKPEDAENAMKHMDGGQIDGQEITAAPVLIPRQLPPRRRSPLPMPPRRGPPPRWGRSPPRYNICAPSRWGGLLVEVSSLEMSHKLKTLKCVAGATVSCSPHSSMNKIRGVVYSIQLLCYSEETLQQKFADQEVIKINESQKPTPSASCSQKEECLGNKRIHREESLEGILEG